MKTITVEMVRSWEPCYDPAEVVPENWEGTALDVLNLPVSADDKLWVVLREEVLPETTLREFARWCALQVVDLWDAPEVVRQYLETGNETLRDAARAAAWSAARAAAWSAARAAAADAASAARDAAWSAARAAASAAGAAAADAASAARDAAGDAARAAAWSAARDAAGDAARAAAWDAAGDAARAAARDVARDAAWSAARDVARDAQVEKLKKMMILVD